MATAIAEVRSRTARDHKSASRKPTALVDLLNEYAAELMHSVKLCAEGKAASARYHELCKRAGFSTNGVTFGPNMEAEHKAKKAIAIAAGVKAQEAAMDAHVIRCGKLERQIASAVAPKSSAVAAYSRLCVLWRNANDIEDRSDAMLIEAALCDLSGALGLPNPTYAGRRGSPQQKYDATVAAIAHALGGAIDALTRTTH